MSVMHRSESLSVTSVALTRAIELARAALEGLSGRLLAERHGLTTSRQQLEALADAVVMAREELDQLEGSAMAEATQCFRVH